MRKLLILALFAIATSANAVTLNEKIDRTLDVKPGSELVLSNVNGAVTVRAWDQAKVRIVAEKRAKAGDPDVAKDAMKQLKVDIRQSGDSIVVETKHPRKNDWGLFDFLLGHEVSTGVDYEVYVPRTFNLDVETVNGAVNVSDVSGRLEFSTVNGKIDLTRCGGALEASTTNGGIRAELLKVASSGDIRLSTTNGRITLYVPRSIAADIDADTTNGGIESELPVATTRTSRNSLRGTINGGGTDIRLSTTNGGIDIKTTNAVASK